MSCCGEGTPRLQFRDILRRVHCMVACFKGSVTIVQSEVDGKKKEIDQDTKCKEEETSSTGSNKLRDWENQMLLLVPTN